MVVADAAHIAKVMQKENSSDLGFGHSDHFSVENLGGVSIGGGLDSSLVPESVVLETNSSFGSTFFFDFYV